MSRPNQFFVVLLAHEAKAFEVFGPTTDDWPLTQDVVELQDAGFSVNCCKRSQRSARETKAVVIEQIGQEMGMQHREGLLGGLRKWA